MDNQTKQPIDFMKYKRIYFLISVIVIVPGLISLLTHGLRPAIDFTGGSLIEIVRPHSNVSNEMIEKSLPSGVPLASLQPTGNNTVIIRTGPITKEQNELFKANLASASGVIQASESGKVNPASYINEIRFETVGPTLGKELLQKTITAILLAAGAITLFVSFRFKELKYGITAILAMLHDTLVILGIFSILGTWYGVEVDTLFVTAILTILSFSVHDTIVVFDRIRESSKLYPRAALSGLVNKAVTETLGRSINNSMTIIFMLLALWLMGGETTKWFAFALLIGTVTGTYSSTFTAAPLLLVWDDLAHKMKKKK